MNGRVAWLVAVLLLVPLVQGGCPVMHPNVAVNFTATLNGDQEVPPADTDATGMGTLQLSADESEVTFTITASGFAGVPQAAHFHNAAAGTNGDVVHTLTITQEDDGSISITGTWNPSHDLAHELLEGEIYINIHTDAFPNGEIRGQVERADE